MLVTNDIVNDSRILKEAASLAKMSYNVNVLGIHNSGLESFEALDGFSVKRIAVRTRVLKSRLFLPLKAIEYLIRTFIEALRIDADFYHCHDIDPMMVAWLVARIKRAKLIYDSHELEYDRNLYKPLRWFNRIYERMFINKADHIIVSDGRYRADVMAKKNNCRRPMTFVMNCPPRINITIKDRRKIREELKIREDEKIILYVGKFFPGRGVRNILDALSRLHRVVLVIMGERFSSKIFALTHEFGVEKRVRHIGPFNYSTVVRIASGADLGLVLIENTCLSYYYCTPTKLFDCIAAGIPVIASEFPAMKDIVLHNPVGPIGVCVDPSRPEDIAEAIRKVIEDEHGDYDRMRKSARELHICQFNWENQESKLFEIYNSLKLNE